MRKTINRDYEVPELAGYSKDGKTIYVDRRVPRTLTLKDGRTIDVDRYLIVHETVEKALEDGLGFDYETAHYTAEAAEKHVCESHGIPWDEYQSFWNHWEEETIQKYTSMPPDIDLQPEYDNKDTEMLRKLAPLMKKVDAMARVEAKYKIVENGE